MNKLIDIAQRKLELLNDYNKHSKELIQLDTAFMMAFEEFKREHQVNDLSELDMEVYKESLRILKDLIKNIQTHEEQLQKEYEIKRHRNKRITDLYKKQMK